MANKMISTITFSKKREDLLIFLIDGPKTLDEIRAELHVTSSGMLPQIRKLEEQNLVKQEGKRYYLTDTGLVIAEVFNSFVKTLDVIEKHKEFWESHDLEAIPRHLLKRIYELGDCHLVESKAAEIFEPHKEFFDGLSGSKKVMGISPIFHSSYPSFFLELAQKGTDVSLILTRDVYNKINNEYKDTLKKFLGIPTARLYVSERDIRLASGVSENFFSISLFFKNNGYDMQKDLVSFDYSAIGWGEELFNYFLVNCKKIKNQ